MRESDRLCLKFIGGILAASLASYFGCQIPGMFLRMLGLHPENLYDGSIEWALLLMLVPAWSAGLISALLVMRWLNFFDTIERFRRWIHEPSPR